MKTPAKNDHIYTETAELQDLHHKRIEKLPPSAKLILKILEYNGFLTQKELVEQSYLPPRTVRYALNRLKKEGMLEEKMYFKDGRQCLYSIRMNDREETISNYACGII